MGGLRFVGTSKLHVSFAEYSLFNRARLQKIPIMVRPTNRRRPIECIAECGVAVVSMIDKIIGLFCTRALQKRRYSAKETFNIIDPTDHSHPISTCATFGVRLCTLQHTVTLCNTLVAYDTVQCNTLRSVLHLVFDSVDVAGCRDLRVHVVEMLYTLSHT